MAYPPVIVVDEHDQEIGLEMLSVVWDKGLYHRVARIMVEDAAGRVLLQRRSRNMKLYPGRWDNSAAGHVDEGMGYDSAARQEVAENWGFPTSLYVRWDITLLRTPLRAARCTTLVKCI